MNLIYSELDWRGLSQKLWKGFAPPVNGRFTTTDSGNPAIGFYDDFTSFGGTSLVDGYYVLGTGDGAVSRADTNYDDSTAAQRKATGMGIVNFLATTDNDEAILAGGGSASNAEFKLDQDYGFGDLCFECRILSDILLTNDWAWYAGLIEGGGQATTKCFDVNQDPAGTHDQLGFIKLMASTTSVDTYCNTQAGASDKGTAGIHTNVASEYVKLGMRWIADRKIVKFYVNGTEKSSYQLKVSDLTAGTFPDDNFMTPIVAVVTDQATDMTAKLDWWACAQYLRTTV